MDKSGNIGDKELRGNKALISSLLNSSIRENQPADIDSIGFEQYDWTFERSVEEPEEIVVGDTAPFRKSLTKKTSRRSSK